MKILRVSIVLMCALFISQSAYPNDDAVERDDKKDSNAALPQRKKAPYFPINEFLDLTSPRNVSNKDLINSNLDPSYITLGSGLNLVETDSEFVRQLDDNLYEAEINYHLNCLEFEKALLNFTAKIRIRQFAGYSNPIRTPGFLPRLTCFFWFDEDQNKALENKEDIKDSFTYYSVMFSHHSNGQSGKFYREDDTVNTEDGNFSTDFFEFSGYHISDLPYLPSWTQLSLTWHQDWLTREPLLDDQYEVLKVKATGKTKYHDLFYENWKFKLLGSMSYIPLGKDYIRAPNDDYPNIDVRRASEFDKMQFSLEFHSKIIPWMNRVHFFVKFDYGYDYYNIHFQERFQRIQIGISGDQFDYFR